MTNQSLIKTSWLFNLIAVLLIMMSLCLATKSSAATLQNSPAITKNIQLAYYHHYRHYYDRPGWRNNYWRGRPGYYHSGVRCQRNCIVNRWGRVIRCNRYCY